jgi:prevent-host-death family protein
MGKTVSAEVLRNNLDELLGDVADRGRHDLITREGGLVAALLPIGEYEVLEETLQILSDAGAVVAIEEGLAELRRNETMTLNDLRQELADRRPNDATGSQQR